LNSDIIHLRRADGRDWDGFMHVNPFLKEKGLVMLFNPLPKPISRTIILPMYYTGLKSVAKIMQQNGKTTQYKINANQTIRINIAIPAQGYMWMIIE
jgi:hypothetical protein